MRTREKVLSATLGLIADGGFGAVNIAAVASAAGVSRQTVYTIFGTREDLVSQSIAGLAVDVLAGIESRLALTDSAVSYVVELIVAARSAVRADPVLATLFQAGQGNPVFDSGMMTRAKPIAHQLLAPMVARYPDVEPLIDDIVHIALRLGLSVILFDDDAVHDDGDLRRFLSRWLQPAMPTTGTSILDT